MRIFRGSKSKRKQRFGSKIYYDGVILEFFFRLATALARLRIVNTVEKEDVNEAMRLMEMSKDSLTLGLEDRPGRTKTVMDRIYDVIREMVPIGSQATLKVGEIKERCTSKGFKPDQIDDAIAEYERLNIFHVNDARTKITFVDAN